MIEKISGISVQGRCFSSLTSFEFFPSDDFRLSLIYGANGSGKSTISAAFNALGDEQRSDLRVKLRGFQNEDIDIIPDNIFVFDENYIDSNVKIDGDGLGSIVLLGEQVDLQSEINASESKIREETAKLGALKSTRDLYYLSTNLLSPQYHWEQLKTILRGSSEWARIDSEIKGNRQNSSVTDAVIREICSMTVSKSIEQLRSEFAETKSLMDRVDAPNPLYSREVPQIAVDGDIEDKLSDILALKLEEPVLTERERLILTMVNGGYQQQVENSKAYFSKATGHFCPYCYQEVSEEYRNGLTESINRVLNKDVDLHKEQLSAFRLDILPDSYEQYSALDAQLVVSLKKAIQKYNDIAKAYTDAIQSKIHNIYTPTILKNMGMTSALSLVSELLFQLEEKRKKFVYEISQRSQLQDDLIRINKEIAHLFCLDVYKSFLKQQEEQTKANRIYLQQAEVVRQQEGLLSELKQRKENLILAIDCINSALSFVFFSKNRLSIEFRDGKYYLKSNGCDVKPKNVSQGERNIIALCYFFVQITSNQELSKLYAKEQLLVIDDPVSSFDFENKVGVLSLLRRELKKVIFGNSNSKVVLLSHDLTTIFDLQKALDEICKASKADAKISGTNYSWKELYDYELRPFTKKRSEYAHLLNDVFAYANGEENDNVIAIGNKMRRVLEAFSTFCYRKNIEDVSCDRAILVQLDKHSDYFENRMYRLVLHGESHFEEQIYNFHDAGNFYEFISEDEKRHTARDILCFMYLLNQQHIKAYLPSSEREITKWCEDILKDNTTNIDVPSKRSDQVTVKRKIVKLYDLPISAGSGIIIFDDLSCENYPTELEECDFALRILGDSMEPDILNGSVVLLKKQETLEAGEIGAFFYNGEVYCKKLGQSGRKIQLVSINSKYPPLIVNEDEDLKCYGKVIGIENMGTNEP